jgi:hypothetical protein
MSEFYRSAFDTSFYQQTSDLPRFVDDLSSYVIEASMDLERINPYHITPDEFLGTVNNPRYQKKLLDLQKLSADPKARDELLRFKLSEKSTREIHQLMTDSSDQPHVIVWINNSHAGLWDRASINFYLSTSTNSYNCFGIYSDLSDTQCEELHASLQTDNRAVSSNSPLKLTVPDGLSPLEFLRSVLPLSDSVWDFIFSGQAEENKRQAEETARIIAPAILYELSHSKDLTPDDYLRIGVMTEQLMTSAGFRVSGRISGCGFSNAEIQASRYSAFPASLFRTTVKPETKTDTSPQISCPKIFCRQCGWEPTFAQLVEMDAGLLCRCPDCRWVPGTSVAKTLPEIKSEPVPERSLAKVVKKNSAAVDFKSETSYVWSWDYFFFPWIDAGFSASSETPQNIGTNASNCQTVG